MIFSKNKSELEKNGFSILSNIYTDEEIDLIAACIENSVQEGNSFMKTKNLFAIRQLLKNIPELNEIIFNDKLSELILALSKSKIFLTKAIYFDKPSESNWFVAYHQDLSISVNQKAELEGYTNWTFKKGQYGVQPPIHILQDTITIRIHLDKTTARNGALKVIPSSHLNGIIRSDSNKWNLDNEKVCEVEKGGGMLMKPLTLHASNRTTNGKQRRVIHLEFNKDKLPEPLNWLECFIIGFDKLENYGTANFQS